MLGALRSATHLFAPLTANCRTFHAKWESAGRAGGPAGRWEGDWRSTASGHHGPLRCVIEVLDRSTWRATFHAGYARVLRACYATDLRVTVDAGRWVFTGSSDLGRLGGGRYDYDGEATASDFTARYRSATDHGEFRLTRRDEGLVREGFPSKEGLSP